MFAFSKRLINKNCNHLTCYVGRFFLGKFDSLFCDDSPNICENLFLNSPNFMPCETSVKHEGV